MLVRILIAQTIIGVGLLGVLLNATNPGSLGPLGILLVFISGYMLLLGVVTFFLFYSSRLYGVVRRAITHVAAVSTMSLLRAYYFSTVLALLPMIWISLSSVGEVRIYEMLLLGIFGGIGIIYVAKRT